MAIDKKKICGFVWTTYTKRKGQENRAKTYGIPARHVCGLPPGHRQLHKCRPCGKVYE